MAGMRAKRPVVCEHQLFVFTDSIALAGAIFLASTRIRDHPRNGVVDANYKVHSVQKFIYCWELGFSHLQLR
ncbi:MAG: hypothetical protein E6J73_02050 [Deltaproteobacteria bacterium]|nr:MAG: hypothetical protein E6J73_02050 [Deltaproteobacteria bacterium]